MKITVRGGPQPPDSLALLVVPVYHGKARARVDPAWKAVVPRSALGVIDSGDFSAREGSVHVAHPSGKGAPERVLFVGLGERGSVSAESLRIYGGCAASQARNTTGSRAAVLLPSAGKSLTREDRVRATGEGLALGAYRFESYKSPDEDAARRVSSLTVMLEDRRGAARARAALEAGSHVGYGVNLCRDLGNTPGNDLGPVELAARARKEARAAGLSVRVLDQLAIEKEGMGALLGVARGSERPPRFIVLEYRPGGAGSRRSARPLVFVGKAITFDTGGISLKNPEGMQDMKFDMCGGGAVLGAMAAIGRLAPKRRVIGIISSAENMPGGSAIRPGDVLTSAAGLTIEIINTDAEGRLVLADALHYAKRYDPALVVDLATLTGACVVALGAVNTGLFTADAALAEKVRQAGARAGEKLWPMPLSDEYAELMKSEVADLKNSAGRWAGAVTAAAFLSRFIEGHPWVHLDVAGTAWTDRVGPYQTKGATGAGVRTLVELATG